MIRLGICNELFEDWEFDQVCRTVKALGYDGLEIAPFTLAPLITELTLGRLRTLRMRAEDVGLAVIGIGAVVGVLVGAVAVVLPLQMGIRAMERMEF